MRFDRKSDVGDWEDFDRWQPHGWHTFAYADISNRLHVPRITDESLRLGSHHVRRSVPYFRNSTDENGNTARQERAHIETKCVLTVR